MIYLDANILYASVANVKDQTDSVARLLARQELLQVSSLADYEARKALLTQGGTADHLALLDSLLAARFKLNTGWDAAISQALKVARQFKQRLWVDSADTLHVGWALALGAETFASFDRASGPRALALCLGLKLWPEPAPMDYEQLNPNSDMNRRLRGWRG